MMKKELVRVMYLNSNGLSCYNFGYSDGSVLTVENDSQGGFKALTITVATRGFRFVGTICNQPEYSSAFPIDSEHLFDSMGIDVYPFMHGIMPDVQPAIAFANDAIACEYPLGTNFNDGQVYFADLTID